MLKSYEKWHESNEIDSFNVDDFVNRVYKISFLGGENPAIQTKFHKGSSPIFLITGQNASGKSLLRRVISQVSRQLKLKIHEISPESKWSAKEGSTTLVVHRINISGYEQDDSTGYNSIKGTLKTMEWAKEDADPNILFLDEPDLGLSEEYAAGLGQHIAQYVRNLSPNTKAVFIITHNRYLINEILPLNPHFWRVGDTMNLQQWLNRKIEPRDVKDLIAANKDTRKRVMDVKKPSK